VGRRLGQHFLARTSILERIAEAACPETEPLVVEIGAGRGALTRPLLERARHVVAIETDPILVEYLQEKFAGVENLTLVRGDVLQLDLAQWGPAVFTGNLPYYITSPVLRKTLLLGELARRAVYLVQLEVAERLVAEPGTSAYGFLTVQVALFAKAEILFRVPASAFRPPPKVESALVRLIPHPQPLESNPADFLDFVARCFRQKRKTIRNNLAGYCDPRRLAETPEAALRAEQLSPAQLQALYRRLKPHA